MLTLLLLSDRRFSHFHPNCKYNSGVEMTHAWLGTANRAHSVPEHVAYVYVCAWSRGSTAMRKRGQRTIETILVSIQILV